MTADRPAAVGCQMLNEIIFSGVDSITKVNEEEMQGLLVFKQDNSWKISAITLRDQGRNPGFDDPAAKTAAATQCKNRYYIDWREEGFPSRSQW